MNLKNSLNHQIKAEIIDTEFTQEKFLVILIIFLKNHLSLQTNNQNHEITLQINSYHQRIILFFNKYLKEYFNLIGEIIAPIKSKGLWYWTTNKKEDFNYFIEWNQKNFDPEFIAKLNKNTNLYLIAIFLTQGIISCNKQNIYYIEIAFSSNNESLICQKNLAHLNIDYKIYKKDNSIKIYIKKIDSVSDFLKAVGAHEAMMDLEEIKITNDYCNQIQRLNNLDIANLNKSIQTSQEQIKIIEYLKNNNLIETFEDKIQKFIHLRLKYPEVTLQKLAEYFYKEYGIQISKSGLNHYSRYIRQYYLENSKDN